MTWLLLVLQLAKPDLSLTPGAVRPLSTASVCGIRWGLDTRHVTLAMRLKVFASYGIPYIRRQDFELDHLVPRSLGGQDAVANLWPEPLGEAKHLKDPLENRLGRMVCAGTLTLDEAQTAIRTDWIAAYTKYFGKAPR